MEGNSRLFVGRYAGVSSLETRDSRCQYVSSVFLRCQDLEDVEAAAFPKTSIRVHLLLCVSDLIFVDRVMRYGQHINVVLLIGGRKVFPRDQTKELEQFRRCKRLQGVDGNGNA